MSNHPNRGPKGPQSNPAPADIRAARKAAGLTQTQAGEMVHSSCRAWQQWESGDRRMHPATWALFLIRSSTDDERRAAFIAWRGEQPPPQALEDAWMAACAWIDQTG